MTTPAIELDHLSVSLGRRPILRDLSVRLEKRAVGLLGPNGAGKTTLIRTLLGFHAPSGGSARLLGHDVTDGREIRAALGYMPESDAFVGSMTGIRFVRLMAELAGLPTDAALERSHEALFFVGLGEARYRKIGSYSLGMKQMAKLAQALVHGPRLLFLDEPTNGLDPGGRKRMLDLIGEIRDRGEATVVVSSHLLRDVETVCDEVVVLRDGHLVAHTDLEEERLVDRRLLELEIRGGDGAFTARLVELGCECAVGSRRRLKVMLAEDVTVRDLYRVAEEQDVQIRRLVPKRHSLEDIFLSAMDEPAPGAAGEPMERR